MDRKEASQTGQTRQQVFSKPHLIRELFPKLDRQVRSLLDHETCFNIRRIFVGGSGDSHNAALAAEMAFEAISRLPMEVLTGMSLSRYTLPWLPPNELSGALMIGISVSGEVTRTLEAIQLANARGVLTMGLTNNSQSSLAKTAHLVLDLSVPPPLESPGVRTYAGSVLALYALALRLAEVREAISQQDGDRWRKAILSMADVIEKTNEQISAPVKDLAAQLKERQYFMFVGSGPNYGTALFGAAKLVEASGKHVLGQDIEEWAHLQRFDKEQGNPCFLLAPSGVGYRRAVELAGNIKKTGKYLIAVVEQGERDISAVADAVLPVVGHVPEVLSPLVYCSALEMFASDLAQELGEPYFRFGLEPFESSGGNLIIRKNEILNLEALQQVAATDLGQLRFGV